MNFKLDADIIKITVIGSGNAFNSSGRSHSSYLVETSTGKFFLMDAGPTTLYRLKQMHFPSDRIDCILFTHFHGDHMGGIPFLLLDMDIMCKRKREIILMGPRGISEKWKSWYKLAYGDHRLAFEVKTVELSGEEVFFTGVKIIPGKITHNPESIGYRIEDASGRSLAYTGDSFCDENMINLMRNTDMAIMELSMEKQTNPPTAHVSLEELQIIRNRLGTKRLILTHTTDEISRKAVAMNLGEAAFDGMELFIQKRL